MFQSALLESAANRGRRTLRFPLAAAAALHGAAILAIVGASLWSPGDAPSLPAQIVFETRVPPPSGGEDRAHRAAPSRAVKRAFVQPVPIQQELAASQDPPEHSRETAERDDLSGDGGHRDGVPGAGSGAGTEDGIPGGTGQEDPAGHDAIIPATSATEMPVLLVRRDPAYPEAARRLRSEGLVVLEAVISGTGVIENVRVVKSVDALLDMAAVRAVEQWRYRPATLNGRAVRVALTVSVRFSLH
jgi:protein TonB